MSVTWGDRQIADVDVPASRARWQRISRLCVPFIDPLRPLLRDPELEFRPAGVADEVMYYHLERTTGIEPVYLGLQPST